MLPGFEALVENRILKAQKNGELDDLPGQGKPLDLDDMSIPEDCRMAWRVLKNSGFLPPEVEIRKEIKQLENILITLGDQDRADGQAISGADIQTTRAQIYKKLNFLLAKLNISRGNCASPVTIPEAYKHTLVSKISTGKY